MGLLGKYLLVAYAVQISVITVLIPLKESVKDALREESDLNHVSFINSSSSFLVIGLLDIFDFLIFSRIVATSSLLRS